ncbi:MAG TPA: preprotein translocase subunit SecG [Allosphingosinicella sp.]|nr:preprotein translocase subunit SecG [Allosphingosinicella sp.]
MAGFFTFILIVQTLVAVSLITLILMQRSEGGGLAGGGSPAGMMSARGASDFLTRGTAILATVFVALSILLAALAAGQRGERQIDPGLLRPAAPAPTAPAGPIPGQSMPGAVPGLQPAPGAAPAPAPAPVPGQPAGNAQ